MGGDLLTMVREFDLPPKSDGCVVRWDPWRDQPDMFICPPPRERSVCPQCGSVEKRVTTKGLVAKTPNTTLDRIANYERVGKLGAVAYYRLFAFRCVECKHDQVMEFGQFGGSEWWDLDFTDYGPDGSR